MNNRPQKVLEAFLSWYEQTLSRLDPGRELLTGYSQLQQLLWIIGSDVAYNTEIFGARLTGSGLGTSTRNLTSDVDITPRKH